MHPQGPSVTHSSTGVREAVTDGAGGATMGHMAATPRFLTLADVAEVLNTSSAQVYALVRRGDLPAIKIGGRGQWRVESSMLEDYIARMYKQAEDFVAQHPFVEADTTE